MFDLVLGLAAMVLLGTVLVPALLVLWLLRDHPRNVSRRWAVAAAALTTIVSAASLIFTAVLGIFVAFCDYGGSCVDDYLRPFAVVLLLSLGADVAAMTRRWTLAALLSVAALLVAATFLASAFSPFRSG